MQIKISRKNKKINKEELQEVYEKLVVLFITVTILIVIYIINALGTYLFIKYYLSNVV
jgi:hypothetical protein